MSVIKPGDVFEHFRGTRYRIIAKARDTSNETKQIVIYYEDGKDPSRSDVVIWARPLEEFNSIVLGGELRFKKISEA